MAFSNLGLVRNRRIVIYPGQRAVVTVTGAAATPGCVTRWALRLTLPAGDRQVTVRAPGSSFAPCVGGQLRLSPFYREDTLKQSIRALSGTAISSPFPLVKHEGSVACRPAGLRAEAAHTVSRQAGSLVVLRLRASGGSCVLAEGWPTVRLHESAGASPVAKAFPDTEAFSATTKVARALRPGGTASIALLAAATGRAACRRVKSATIYPSPVALGAGLTVTLARPLSFCGEPRILPYLPASGKAALTIAKNALAAAESGTTGVHPAGWWHGTDSSYPHACGTSVPYYEPKGDCSNGTDGYYGAYIGEIGTFQNWQGCASGLNWVQGNYNAAQANAAHGHGLGAAGYWFAAGPGRDPNYNGTTSEANTWGTDQAKRLFAADLGDGFYFPYVVMDIENNGAPPDHNGWNTVWNGPCGGKVESSFISQKVARATVRGFLTYSYDNTAYFPAVYSAGDDFYGSWTGIFGSETLPNTSEWTLINETSSVSKFPSRWSVNGMNARFFGGARANCQLLWQWSGGNGVLNKYGGDLDQVDGTHNGECLDS